MGRFLDLCTPDQLAPRLSDVSLDDLKSRGVEAMLLDLDNTMLPWQSLDVPQDTREWIEKAKGLDFKLCIVSNTHHPRRLRRIAEELGVASIHGALKPRKRGFLRACEMLGVEPDKCAVIGDQVFTDILGGNLAGMRTVLVKPMARREFVGTKISRLFERIILGMLRRRGRLGTNSQPTQSQKQDTK